MVIRYLEVLDCVGRIFKVRETTNFRRSHPWALWDCWPYSLPSPTGGGLSTFNRQSSSRTFWMLDLTLTESTCSTRGLSMVPTTVPFWVHSLIQRLWIFTSLNKTSQPTFNTANFTIRGQKIFVIDVKVDLTYLLINESAVLP